jgi:hypothetical protein
MTRPTIPQAFTAKHAAFTRHVPFGDLLASDRTALLRCVARDAGVSLKDAHDGIAEHLGEGVQRG